jgi:hypothetical protein
VVVTARVWWLPLGRKDSASRGRLRLNPSLPLLFFVLFVHFTIDFGHCLLPLRGYSEPRV